MKSVLIEGLDNLNKRVLTHFDLQIIIKLTTLYNKVVNFHLTILLYNIPKERLPIMSLRSQLLKGILDGCVLSVIEKEPIYGYELSKKLQAAGLNDVSEGTIYPVLLRLQKNGLIRGEMQPSLSGPNRKYYFLTEAGHEALTEISLEWEQVVLPVSVLLKRRKGND
jgi:PadR family transcriptional regulator PadR